MTRPDPGAVPAAIERPTPPPRSGRRPRGGSGGCSRRRPACWAAPRSAGTTCPCRLFTLPITPGCSRASSSAPSSALARSETAAFSAPLSGPAFTRAVRRPDRSECSTQPSVPSASRIRRQVSNSPTISTGRPARWKTQSGPVILGGTLAQVDAVGLEAGIARQRQLGHRADAGLRCRAARPRRRSRGRRPAAPRRRSGGVTRAWSSPSLDAP